MYLFVVRCKIKSHKEVQKYDAGKHDTKRKIEHIFGGGVLLDVLKQIDELPAEIAIELRGIVYSHEKNGQIIEKRRNKNLDELVRLGYLKEIICDSETLDKKYTKDKLFVELSKKMYDFQPKSNTTKKEMVEYILSDEKAVKRLARKYFTAVYTDEFKVYARDLGNFLEKLLIKHPYMTTDVKLVDFYYELQGERKREEQKIDTMAKNLVSDNKRETQGRKDTFFSRLFKK